MAQTVRDLPEGVQEIITVREWDMRNPGHLDVFKTANVRRLPSIAIAGELLFEALIPDREELVEAIQHRYLRGSGKNSSMPDIIKG